MHQWMSFDWTWMVMMFAWLLLIGVVGYAAVLMASQQSNHTLAGHRRPRRS